MLNNLKSVTNYQNGLLDQIDFRRVFFKMVDNKWLILIITFFSFLCGGLYTLTITPKYVSSALIQVDSQLGSANSMQQMLGNVGIFTSVGQASPAEIEIALIKSRFILQSVVDKLNLNLTTSPVYFPIIGKAIARYRNEGGLTKPIGGLSQFAWGGEQIKVDKFEVQGQTEGLHFYLRPEDSTHYRLYENDGRFLLQGELGKIAKTDAGETQIAMLVTKLTANPGTYFNVSLKFSDDILKNISEGLSIIDLGDKNKNKTGVLQLSFQGTHPEATSRILDTIIEFAILRNIEKKSAEASKTLDFLNRQLPSVRKSLENAETALNEYRAKHGTIDISQEARIILMQLSAIEQSIAELKLKKVEMLQELTPKHPYVIALSHKQNQLQKEGLSLENKIKTLPITDQRALSLERDVKVKDQLYLLLLNKIQQLQVLKAGTLSDIRILHNATVPVEPLPMHRPFNLISSTLFGFILSVALIFLRDLFQPGVNDIDLVEERLGIPTYAIIPYSMKQRAFNRKMKRRDSNRAFVLAQMVPKDIAIEGIRSLRTMLEFSKSSNNIISLMGASPGIGKSFIAVNLAQVLVDGGKRVLLIDCDMRKGKLNQFLAQKKSPGFSELLTGDHALSEVKHTIQGNFDFIPTGQYPTNPSEILMSNRFNDLLAQFSRDYEVVVIDTPPILAVTDGTIIAKHSGTNLLVVGSNSDKLPELELVVKRVKRNNITINGLVFNSRMQMKKEYGQYNYYYVYES